MGHRPVLAPRRLCRRSMLEQEFVGVEQGPADVFQPAHRIVAGGRNVLSGGVQLRLAGARHNAARYSSRMISSLRLAGGGHLPQPVVRDRPPWLCTSGPLIICRACDKFESTDRSHWQAVSRAGWPKVFRKVLVDVGAGQLRGPRARGQAGVLLVDAGHPADARPAVARRRAAGCGRARNTSRRPCSARSCGC